MVEVEEGVEAVLAEGVLEVVGSLGCVEVTIGEEMMKTAILTVGLTS